MEQRKVLIRADDLGYCEAVNYGLARAVRQGAARNVSVLSNMEAAEHGVKLLEGANVCYGLHVNICNGRPLTDPAKIPSLVQPNGEFKTASEYRKSKEDFVAAEEAVLEIEAQLGRFQELTGEMPHYMDAHSVFNENFLTALKLVAARRHIPYFDVNGSFYGFVPFGHSLVHTFMEMDSMDPRYDPFETLKHGAMQPTEAGQYMMLLFHPGYVDDDVLKTTYITTARPREAAMLYAPQTRQWLEENHVTVITYDDL